MCATFLATVSAMVFLPFVMLPLPPAAAATSVAIFGFGSGTSPTVQSLPSGVTPTAVASGGQPIDFGGPGTGFAIGADGTPYAWGLNTDGELGEGTNQAFASPVQVALPPGVTATAIAGGNDNGYAIGSDGNLYAWGWNGDGELGDGSTTGPDLCGTIASDQCSFTPVKVLLPAGVTPMAIAADTVLALSPSRGSAAYAIGSDGNLYAWGVGVNGELGDGTTASSDTPVKVALPAGVHPTAIAGAGDVGLAIGSDGSLYAWGAGNGGELGDGTTASSDTPVKVSLPSGVSPVAISANAADGYALGSDGNAYAWGVGTGNGLGNGSLGLDQCPVALGTISSLACSTTPVQVSLPSGLTATAIAGGGNGAALLASDGNLYDWGNSSSVPAVVQLPSGSVPEKLGQGPGSLYAIVATTDTAPTVTTQPGSQSVLAGASVSFTAVASGVPFPTVQWQQSTDGGTTWSNVSGATSNTYSISNVPLSDNGFEFRAVFTNVVGSATTNAATLTVNPTVAPTITTQPTNQSAPVNSLANFTAAASGQPSPSAQWQQSTDGGTTWSNIPLGGASSPTTVGIPALPILNGSEYRAVFTNSVGSATSNPATLTVTAPPPTTSVLLPSNGATIISGTWLDAAASSPAGIASVVFEVSGNGVNDLVVSGSGATNYGYIGAWDSSDVANGTYTVQSVATDALGQSTTSAPITVTVHNPPLNTEVLVPSSGATLNGTNSVLDGTAAGTSPITSIQFVLTGGSLTDQVIGTGVLTLYGYIAVWDTTKVANGTYTLQSLATEKGGTTALSPGISVTVQN
jgi:alpha-tubulin suppressor-like RCC1 family protein